MPLIGLAADQERCTLREPRNPQWPRGKADMVRGRTFGSVAFCRLPNKGDLGFAVNTSHGRSCRIRSTTLHRHPSLAYQPCASGAASGLAFLCGAAYYVRCNIETSVSVLSPSLGVSSQTGPLSGAAPFSSVLPLANSSDGQDSRIERWPAVIVTCCPRQLKETECL